MKLPDVFQMRVDTLPGYTHVVERLPLGRYEVKWARGWSKVRDIEWHVCTEKEAQEFVDEGGWIVVDEKKVGQELPKVFNVRTRGGLYVFEQVSEYKWMCNAVPKTSLESLWSIDEILPNLEGGVWKIIEKQPLTPEQLRSNADVLEQIASLEHNVKLRKQDVEHAEILIANYEARIKDLQSKLVKEA